jgi:uncharacterized repeat protein (TIGR01451 family)
MMSKFRLAASSRGSSGKFYGLIAVFLLGFVSSSSGHAASFLKIEPAEPSVSSCLAFGAGPGGLGSGSPGFDGTSPYMGFIYQNIPPFDLEIGDILSFDLGKENDFDVEMNIALAATTVNGGVDEAGPFTTVVTSLQTPTNPRGDTIIGNFEMQFVIGFPFSFPGGGLIIRFSNGSEAYRQDLTCDESQVGVVATSSDSSGFFVRAFWADDDGLAPWDPDPATVSLTQEIIGGFQISSNAGIALTNTVLDSTGTETLTAAIGDVITYQIVVANNDNVDATGVEVTDTLADELDFLQTTTIPVAGTMPDPGPPQTVVWSVGNLPAGQTATLDIDAQVLRQPFGGMLSNVAEITAIDQIIPSFDLVGLTAESDVSIAGVELTNKVLDSTGTETVAAAAGDVITYQIVATNNAQVDATGVEITDTMADELSFLQTTTTPAAGTVFGVGPPQTVVWSVGNLAAGQSATLEIDAQVLFGAIGKDLINASEVTAIDQPFAAGFTAGNFIAVIELPDDILSYSDGGNCFIATAAFGSYLEPEVRILRKFRDEYLMAHEAGRAFVEWYYRTSPPAAALIRDHAWMRTVVRAFLGPAVYGLKYPVQAAILIFSLFLLLIIFYRVFYRRIPNQVQA